MNNKNLGLLIIRLALGILMLFHGISKFIHGIDGIENMLNDKGIPEIFAYGVYVGEIAAPLLLVVGYRTRIAALLFFANMLVILFIAHPNELLTLNSHGAWSLELPGLYLFGSLSLFFTGAGRYAFSSGNRWD